MLAAPRAMTVCVASTSARAVRLADAVTVLTGQGLTCTVDQRQ